MKIIYSEAPEWYCVRTQTKREHIAAKHLRELEGVETFCPRLKFRKATRRGKIWWTEPLFPGYLLARFALLEMERAVTFCQGVRGLVRFGSKIPCVQHSFVEAIRCEVRDQSSNEDELLTIQPVIQIGEDVELADGPLRGMQGIVLEVLPAAERVKILLEFLGQMHPVDVDLFSLLLPKHPLHMAIENGSFTTMVAPPKKTTDLVNH